MLNSTGTSAKFNRVLVNSGVLTGLPINTGTLRSNGLPDDYFSVHVETKVRVEFTGTSVVIVEASITGSSIWTTLTVTSGVVDVSTYDYIRFRVTTAGTPGTVIASGFISFI